MRYTIVKRQATTTVQTPGEDKRTIRLSEKLLCLFERNLGGLVLVVRRHLVCHLSSCSGYFLELCGIACYVGVRHLHLHNACQSTFNLSTAGQVHPWIEQSQVRILELSIEATVKALYAFSVRSSFSTTRGSCVCSSVRPAAGLLGSLRYTEWSTALLPVPCIF